MTKKMSDHIRQVPYESNISNIIALYLPLGISIFFVAMYVSCTQFLPEDIFIWSPWVIAIPNIVLLAIYDIIGLIFKKTGIKMVLSNILLSIMLYCPFILIELKGQAYDYSNYIITFSFCFILGVLFYIVKNKTINFTLSLILLLLSAILYGYYIIYTRLLVVEIVLKMLIILSLIGICIVPLLKEKYNYKKIIFSIIFLILSLIIFYCLGDTIQIYSKHILLSALLIIAVIIQRFLNIKIIKDYSFIIYIFIFFVCIATICREISFLCVRGLESSMNYLFLVSNVLFLVLILLQKYVSKIEYKKELKIKVLLVQ